MFRERSAAVGASRVKKMKSRDDLLEELKKSALDKLAALCKGPQYPAFVKNLIVEGLIKIEEDVVEIQTRPEDKTIVSGVLNDAVAEYKKVMTAAGHKVNAPQVKVSALSLNSKACSGGVVLTALDGRIVLDQTVDERLNISYSGIMPAVRYGLFSA